MKLKQVKLWFYKLPPAGFDSSQSQNVTHPNRISYYIMVAEVKKQIKLLD